MSSEHENKRRKVSDTKSAQNALKAIEQSEQANAKNGILRAKIIETPLGSLVAVANDKNLVFLTFYGSKHFDESLKRLLKINKKGIIDDGNSEPLRSIEAEIKKYFDGELKEFETPIEINPLETEFQRAVWKEIHKIGYGKTVSYAELAKSVGNPKSTRAAANACGKNPISIVIPCHRVLASNGLGGYGACTDRKIFLLDIEKKHMKE